MDNRKKLAWGGAVLLLALITAWGMGWFGEDPAIAKLQEIGDQMSESNLPDAQRDQLRDQFRQQMQSLTDDQRRAYFNTNRDGWQARQQQRMDEFFGLPKGEQQKRLDEMIGRMNRPRDGQSPRGDGRTASSGRGGGGSRAGRTESQREERSKRRLDGSTPKMRAQYAEFRRLLGQRAQQLGVNVNNWRRGA
jgi:hypothetical protein